MNFTTFANRHGRQNTECTKLGSIKVSKYSERLETARTTPSCHSVLKIFARLGKRADDFLEAVSLHPQYPVGQVRNARAMLIQTLCRGIRS
mmetsp:Transcript_18796/g.75424  ORF Transcript_18796/g.75424 Transcript_18796/m.75424 type:complete len:91 (+) Transcript_18796:883-1155(+)